MENKSDADKENEIQRSPPANKIEPSSTFGVFGNKEENKVNKEVPEKSVPTFAAAENKTNGFLKIKRTVAPDTLNESKEEK